MFVIAAVTAAMIAILSAFNGIESVVTELFGTLDAPVAIVPAEGAVVPNRAGTWVMDRFGPESTNPVVQCAAPVIEDEAVVAWATANHMSSLCLGLIARCCRRPPSNPPCEARSGALNSLKVQRAQHSDWGFATC